jgi:hypothetical protein
VDVCFCVCVGALVEVQQWAEEGGVREQQRCGVGVLREDEGAGDGE